MLRWTLLLRAGCALWAGGLTSVGVAQDYNSLLQRSPFSVATPGQQAAADAPLEFRSVLVDRGEFFFSIYQPSAHAGLWVSLNEPGNPFTVTAYDEKAETVKVSYQGRTLSLVLKESKIQAFVQKTPPPNATAPAPGAPLPAGVAAPADEANRLARIAEEIRRRRALRQQATPPPNAPGQSNVTQQPR